MDVSQRRQAFKKGKQACQGEYLLGPSSAQGALRLLQQLLEHTDAALTDLWNDCGMSSLDCCLVAVGGYGRAELYPYSDVDLLVLIEEGSPHQDAVSRFIAHCWDVGIEVGSSVRTVAECISEARRDITVETCLMEHRFLAGDPALFHDFQQRMKVCTDPVVFFRAKHLELQQRHHKFENTPYALEPNCKESPGGLRDLHFLIWVSQAANLGRTWTALCQHGLISDWEASRLQDNHEFLQWVRTELHLAAGRREDRLLFDLQSTLAQRLGMEAQGGLRASERLMRRYYWAAKAVTQLHQILMLSIQERVAGRHNAPMRPISPRFLERGHMLEVVDDDLYHRDPHAILDTFLTCQTEPGIKGLSARTLRALYRARSHMDARFRQDPVNRQTFMRILTAPGGQTHAFRLMNQTSVLGRYLWPFRRIVGQMQHDLFHVYTVDQHILMVLRNVRRFFIAEHAHEYPLCSSLAAQFDKPWLLVLAALFHDIGKGRGGNHSQIGAAEVRRFAKSHGLAADDAELVEFLVEHHLTLSHTAQKEDLFDAAVIERFAQRVQTPRRLVALYLLTVADIRGTGPKVWNPWKGKLLEDLYRLTFRALGGELPHSDSVVDARKTEARQWMSLRGMLPGGEESLWKTLSVSYFQRHEAQEIAWHTRSLWKHVNSQEPVVFARPSPAGEGMQVLVYAPDATDLFARICAWFDRAHYTVQDARIHTSLDLHAIDTFQVMSPLLEDPQIQSRDLLAYVETGLRNALMAKEALPAPRLGRDRPSRRVRFFPVPARINLQPDERSQRWILEVSAHDRAGLLYAIAKTLATHGINLHLAKVSTLGERVEDTFLIDGPLLTIPKALMDFERDLLSTLEAGV